MNIYPLSAGPARRRSVGVGVEESSPVRLRARARLRVLVLQLFHWLLSRLRTFGFGCLVHHIQG
jgi:hypothetical protein